MITQCELKQLLHYDINTGIFTWKVSRGNQLAIGSIAGGKNDDGYVKIRIGKKKYAAHRLAWLYVMGIWPADQLDHRDGNRSNNAFSNLRECTNAQNCENKKVRSDNPSGYPGVTWCKSNKKWKVSITKNKIRHHLGYFINRNDAYNVYLDAKRKLHTFNPVPR
jgi:hypothetical protein